MTFNENYHQMKPIEFDGMPSVFQHMKRVTREQLFEGAEWPMSFKTEKKFYKKWASKTSCISTAMTDPAL